MLLYQLHQEFLSFVHRLETLDDPIVLMSIFAVLAIIWLRVK